MWFGILAPLIYGTNICYIFEHTLFMQTSLSLSLSLSLCMLSLGCFNNEFSISNNYRWYFSLSLSLCCFLLAALMMSSLYQTITDGIFCLVSISAVSLVACTYLFVYLVFVVLLLLCIGICKFLDGCFHD